MKVQLPEHLVSRNDGFRRFQDRQRNLFGLLLLDLMWFTTFGDKLEWNKLKTTEHNRPYIEGSTVDFNISHAGDYVICVLSGDSKVGIDIELKKQVDLNDYKRTMNGDQWAEIHQSQEPIDTFFKYWCMKESVIKADGRGLAIPLTEIVFERNKVTFPDQVWNIRPFKLDTDHFGCLACNEGIAALELEEVHWKQFVGG